MCKRVWQATAISVCAIVFGLVLLFQYGNTMPADPHATANPPAEPADAVVHFVVEPYLQFPTRESIVIMWETSFPGTSVVEYGTKSGALESVELKDLSSTHEVGLSGLKPNTKYFYRVSTIGE